MGDYFVALDTGSPRLKSVRVSVSRSGRTEVSLDSPIFPVSIRIHANDQPCDTIDLRPIGRDFATPIDFGTCIGNEVEFRSVMPGAYRVCVGTNCQPIEVSWSSTWFEIDPPP
jgi:hypothetical protein